MLVRYGMNIQKKNFLKIFRLRVLFSYMSLLTLQYIMMSSSEQLQMDNNTVKIQVVYEMTLKQVPPEILLLGRQ